MTHEAAAAPIAELLTVKALAEETGIPENTFRWWRHAGSGPKSFKVGRRVMYRREDVDAWLNDAYKATGR